MNIVAPVDRYAVIPRLSIWTALEDLPVSPLKGGHFACSISPEWRLTKTAKLAFGSGIIVREAWRSVRVVASSACPHRAVLEINDNGSLGEAFAPAPVIGRDRTQRFGFTMLANMALQLPKDSAAANGYPQTRQQPFR
jgi:hypothetical protein